MVGGKKLLFTLHFRPIPQTVRNSLQRVENCANVPFLPKSPSVLATNLIKSYFDRGLIREARILFDEMPQRDVVAWTAIIAGYTSTHLYSNAWEMFCGMGKNQIDPNEFTISNVLKACKGMSSLSCGSLAHGMAIKHGVEVSIYVQNALLNLYATCSSMDDAHSVFRCVSVKNAVSWTTLIAGYTSRGDGHGGLQVFKKMMQDEEPNSFSLSIAVKACTLIGSHVCGKQIHAAVIKKGFQYGGPVMNSILDMYCKCSCLADANRCFHEITVKDLITWNTLIAGYQKMDPSESLHLFSEMELEGFTPNCLTFTTTITACADLAVLSCGQQLHGGILRRGHDQNSRLANALIHMYAKCGNIYDSRKVFNEMSDKDLVSWTSMMIGYGAHGYGQDAVELFNEMVQSGIRPDQQVFMAVLSACSHAGLVDEGMSYFRSMTAYFNLTPDQEIYGCVVDLLGRAGRVEEAYQLIGRMPFNADESVWGALLGACKAHKILRLGKVAALKALALRPDMLGAYVMLSNIYASEGKWGEFARIRKTMRGMGSRKETGRSWIEVKNVVFSFAVGHKMGTHMEQVYGILDLLIGHIKEAGYVIDLECLEQHQEDGL